MALASTDQADFGAGIYRGREAPPNAVYDAVNALVDDEGQLFRRGGGSYVTTSNAGANLFSLKSSYLPMPSAQRTIAFSATNHYAVNGSSFVTLGTPASGPYPPPQGSRIAAAGKIIVWPVLFTAPTELLVGTYGGSLKASEYTTGTVTVTNGSATVTGSGTSWSANVDAGMFFDATGGTTRLLLVKSVTSNTSLILDQPWNGTTAAGVSYAARPVEFLGSSPSLATIFQPALSSAAQPYVAYVGRRILMAYGTRIAFTSIDEPSVQSATDYHELPGDAFITGLDGIGDTAYVFTTEGVWTIAGLFLDPVDAYGNIQHAAGRNNKNVILWGDSGLAAWTAGFVVPAIDDVYLLGPDGSSVAITGNIRPLYRSYVAAGYQPGLATTHRGHYFLPIMSGTTLIDTLVCRLDRDTAWTRWAGHSAAPGYATQVGATTRSPKLLAVQGQRVLDLTGTLVPASTNALDADGTTSDCVITTRDFPLGQQPGLVKKARLRYELTDDGSGGTAAPTVALAFSSDQDAGTFTTLTDKGLQGGGTAGAVSAGDKYSWWLVAKKRERLRLRITVTGACASFVLRSVELLLRASGKQ